MKSILSIFTHTYLGAKRLENIRLARSADVINHKRRMQGNLVNTDNFVPNVCVLTSFPKKRNIQLTGYILEFGKSRCPEIISGLRDLRIIGVRIKEVSLYSLTRLV